MKTTTFKVTVNVAIAGHIPIGCATFASSSFYPHENVKIDFLSVGLDSEPVRAAACYRTDIEIADDCSFAILDGKKFKLVPENKMFDPVKIVSDYIENVV